MKNMKRLYLFALLLCSFFAAVLTGCGKQEKGIYVQAAYEALLYEDREDMYVVLGEQYYQGEAVRISCNREGDIFLHRDGKEAEIFLTNMSSDYADPDSFWWLDEDGNIFVLRENTVILLDAEGKETARIMADGPVTNICRGKDGRLVIKISDPEKFTNGLAFLDMEARKIGEISWLNGSVYGMAAGAKQDILLVDESGICDYNLAEKKKEYYMDFSNADYTPAGRIWDIHYISESQIDLLTDREMLITLRKINLAENGKIYLTYKSTHVSSDFRELIVRFNQQNENYYILVEECPEGFNVFDYREKVSMEIAAGHGPDMIDELSVPSVYKLQEIGALENLVPYIEAAGIGKAAYYDGTFLPWEGLEDIYALRYGMRLSTMCIDGEVLGITMKEWDFSEKWDIDTMLNTLEAYEGDKAYYVYADSARVLTYFLEYSRDLCGIVDWEQRICRFEGKEWERLVNLAERYGYKEEKRENGWVFYSAPLQNFSFYSALENGMWESNKIPVGYAGDTDGIMELTFEEMYMNSSSAHKEGVWQFFSFLLQEDTQYSLGIAGINSIIPVHRQAFADAAKYYMDNPFYIHMQLYGGYDNWSYGTDELTEEQVVRLEEWIDRAEIVIWRRWTDPILEIIEEEMEVYYAGGKPLEEVSALIQNRVQLYLNELD
ncbi:MAG: hypothetical protein J1E83_12020 [Lachnospiraceae bacterium]|nr:hypothetical protein [Lachnospiraceae bacterium]